MSPLKLLLILFLHLLFLSSVFDIYFKSTVLTNISVTHSPGYEGPAKRLFLIVTDGLRADSLFKSEEVRFLHKMATERGSWGIAHTRVPTESRCKHFTICNKGGITF